MVLDFCSFSSCSTLDNIFVYSSLFDGSTATTVRNPRLIPTLVRMKEPSLFTKYPHMHGQWEVAPQSTHLFPIIKQGGKFTTGSFVPMVFTAIVIRFWMLYCSPFPSGYQISHWHRFKESEQCSEEICMRSNIHSSSDWQEFTGPVEDPGHLDQRAHDDLSLYWRLCWADSGGEKSGESFSCPVRIRK